MAELFIESQSGQSDLLNTVYSSEVTWGSAIPKGMIAPFGRTAPPEGWLICDGSTLNALQDVMYRSLFDAIGTTWGGTGENDFQIPDLRGAFLRGIGNGLINGRDKYGPTNVGDFQEDQMQGHKHEFNNYAYHSNGANSELVGVTGQPPMANDGGAGSGVGPPKTDGMNGNPRQGDETRPFNAGVLYCIKY